MKGLNTTVFAFTTLALVSSVAFAEAEHSQSTTVDKDGTQTVAEKNWSKEKNLFGNEHTSDNVTVTVDPKGLGNKQEASATRETVAKSNGDYTVTETFKHADGTLETNETSRATSKHLLDEGKTVVTKEVKTIDPEGMLNQRVRETSNIVESDGKGNVTQKVVKKVDGKIVSEKQIAAK